MRSNKKAQVGRVCMVCVDWGREGNVAGFTTGQHTRRTRETDNGGVTRSEGLVSLQFQNQALSVIVHQVNRFWWHMMGRDLGCGGRAGPGPRANGVLVVGVIGGWRVHPAFR